MALSQIIKNQVLSIFFAGILVLALSSATSQLLKTNLRITVLNELGNSVEGAEVQLFSTFEDYENNQNPATEVLLTDAKGVVSFKGLESKEYYVSAVKDEASNDGGGVQTGKLDAKKINRVNIIIQ